MITNIIVIIIFIISGIVADTFACVNDTRVIFVFVLSWSVTYILTEML